MWQLTAFANLCIAFAYLCISGVITRGLVRTRQWGRPNLLGTATGLIFLSCAIHHGWHALMLIFPGMMGHAGEMAGMSGMDHESAIRTTAMPSMAIWDAISAIIALWYLSLRRSFGALLNGPSMFADNEREELIAALERERATSAEAQRIAHVGVFEIPLDGRPAYRSTELRRLLGVGDRPLVDGRDPDLFTLVHPDDRGALRAHVDRAIAEGTPFTHTFRVRPEDGGQPRWLEIRLATEAGATGETAILRGKVLDVSAEHELREHLEHTNARLAAVLEHSPTAITLRDLDERWVLVNPRAAAELGVIGDELLGRTLEETLAPDRVAAERASDDEVLCRGEATDLVDRPSEDHRHVLASKFPVLRDGTTIGIGEVALDVTAHERARRALRAAEERFEAAFEHAPVGLALLRADAAGAARVEEPNPALAGLLGRDAQDLTGLPLAAFLHPDDVARWERERPRTLDDRACELELRFMHRDGHAVWALVATASCSDETGRPLWVAQVLDISERKRFEGQLQHLADHDALTGLVNRRRFEQELLRELARAKRYVGSAALLILDLDGFKYVNDTLGHSVGDELIVRLAGVLSAVIRPTDVLARIGGDEFALILSGCDAPAAEAVAVKLLEAVRTHGRFLSDGRRTEVTCSIGITTFASGCDISAEELVMEGDIAMYDAKGSGRDRFCVYDRTAERREHLAERQSWHARLKDAFDQDRFVLHAQPIVPVCANGLPRYELLIRLQDEHGDLIPPGTFLYNAERFGLMGRLDRWVMRETVRTLHEHEQAGRPIALAMNLSAKTLMDPTITGDLRETLQQWPISDGRLVIEITETAAITNIARAADLAREIRALGCRLALDDFGAGFASFYYLKHLVFDYLKIDGEFITKLPDTPTDQLVVKAVVDIARGVGAETVAEFVGDQRTLDLLRDMGVGYAQGYFTGRPGPLEPQLPPVRRPWANVSRIASRPE